VKILLDENMPESLVGALVDIGREVDSVNRLKLKGLDNGTLYRQVAVDYDLCFTRDAAFAHNVRHIVNPSQVKVLRVVVPQQRLEAFVPAFVDAFQKSDWARYSNNDDGPQLSKMSVSREECSIRILQINKDSQQVKAYRNNRFARSDCRSRRPSAIT
jgi:predicted nuclease of predicted toxin-antitoxin system